MLKQADPVSGSIISNVLGAKNIMLFCEISESELIHQTSWFISTENTTLSLINRDDRFNLTGNIVMSDGYTVSLNTNMTIVELTAELDGAVISCGAEGSILGNFTLRIYSKPVYYVVGRGVSTSSSLGRLHMVKMKSWVGIEGGKVTRNVLFAGMSVRM